MSTIVKPSLALTRRFKASPAAVYDAWTAPEKVKRWFGPAGVQVVLTEFDARVGGRYRILGRSPDGNEHDVSGVFREVVPGKKLVYTWAWRSTPERESLVTVEFKPDGDGTLLTLTHEHFFDEPARDRHNAGWNGALDKLEAYLG
jgi:uncharacterized protein YndB with AHSA1/START domain